MRKALVAELGGVGAALLGALCCVGPLIFVTFGVGAGLAATFEPLRPVFGVVMLVAFAAAFYLVYGDRFASRGADASGEAPGPACGLPRSRRREKAILWTAVVIAAVFWTFPSWSLLLI